MYVPGASQNPALPSPSLMDWHTLAAARVTGKPWGQGVPSVMPLKPCVCGEQVAPLMAPEPAHRITCTLAAGTPLGVRIGGMSYLAPFAQAAHDRTMHTNQIFLIIVSRIHRAIDGPTCGFGDKGNAGRWGRGSAESHIGRPACRPIPRQATRPPRSVSS